ncbi:unnamed protein product, partial [Rotaria sp. Silwood2]
EVTVLMVRTVIEHFCYPRYNREYAHLKVFGPTTTIDEIYGYVKKYDEDLLSMYDFDMQIFNQEFDRYFKLNDVYLSENNPFGLNNEMAGTQSGGSDQESIKLKVIWRKKTAQDVSQMTSEYPNFGRNNQHEVNIGEDTGNVECSRLLPCTMMEDEQDLIQVPSSDFFDDLEIHRNETLPEDFEFQRTTTIPSPVTDKMDTSNLTTVINGHHMPVPSTMSELNSTSRMRFVFDFYL